MAATKRGSARQSERRTITSLMWNIEDAVTKDQADVELSPDPHGCTITVSINGHITKLRTAQINFVLDLSDGHLRIFKCKPNTDDVIEPASIDIALEATGET